MLHLLLWASQLQPVILQGKPIFDDVSQGLNVEISMQLWTQKEQRPTVDVVRWVEVVVTDVIGKMLRIKWRPATKSTVMAPGLPYPMRLFLHPVDHPIPEGRDAERVRNKQPQIVNTVGALHMSVDVTRNWSRLY